MFTKTEKNSAPIQPHEDNSINWKKVAMTGLIGSAALLIGFLATRYRVAQSNEYLVRTGLFIDGISIDKKAFHLPYQTIVSLDLAPKSYSFTVHAMSQEKMEFILPAVFTIGPKDSEEHLKAYAKYLLYESEENVREIVRGMIEGETRVLAANMAIEEIFKGRTEFKEAMIKGVHHELDKFGLSVLNANIKELQDSAQSRYFSFLAQKITADAENQAKIDISEAKRKGDIGAKEREGTTRQRVAEVESETKIKENFNKNQREKSDAELNQNRALYQQQVQIARIESELNAAKRQEELQKDVELRRLDRETERRRATELSKATVESEIKSTEAAGEANSMKQIADAKLYADMKTADSLLYAKNREAQSIQAIYEAQAEGLQKIVDTFEGDNRALLNYLMIENDLYPKLADASARAIQGLDPKITIWNTGSSDGTSGKMSDFVKNIPPMLMTIEEQTGYSLPDWLLKKNKLVENDEIKAVENTIIQEAPKIAEPKIEIPKIIKPEPVVEEIRKQSKTNFSSLAKESSPKEKKLDLSKVEDLLVKSCGFRDRKLEKLMSGITEILKQSEVDTTKIVRLLLENGINGRNLAQVMDTVTPYLTKS